MVSFFGTDTSPSSGVSSPTIIRNIVVLPEPFGPTRPTLSPGLSWKEASTKRTCRPYCLLTLENEIIGSGHSLACDRAGYRRSARRSRRCRASCRMSVRWRPALDALRMRVNVEAVAAHEADERDAALFGEHNRETRRRRHGRDDWNAGDNRLLHDLERGTAA